MKQTHNPVLSTIVISSLQQWCLFFWNYSLQKCAGYKWLHQILGRFLPSDFVAVEVAFSCYTVQVQVESCRSPKQRDLSWMLLVHTLHKLCIYLLLFLDIFLLDCMKHLPYIRGRCDDGF